MILSVVKVIMSVYERTDIEPDGSTPNDVIRQLLGLSSTEEPATEPGVYLIPHGPKEFKHADDLKEWLSSDLARDGEYAVASDHYWRNVIPGSLCLFHKD